MTRELVSALCLVAVLEGLFLFVTPAGWKRMAERLYPLSDARLRAAGLGVLLVGLGTLLLARG